MREDIGVAVKRKLYAESMGRCMNPSCRVELLRDNGDIIEKAHIDPYCKTADNSFDNLVVLCPNCHTDFDKNNAFTADEVLEWKKIRKKELDSFFSIKFDSFDDLKEAVTPLLLENKTIFENYYLNDNKVLWDKFEIKILCNNRKIKNMFEKNLDLFQKNDNPSYSNLEYVNLFMLHVNEFEETRLDKEKERQVLFPKEINSMFGISPIKDYLLPSTESLEDLITKLNIEGKFICIKIGVDSPYIQIKNNNNKETIFLDDAPRLRQLYYDYNSFRKAKVRLSSLNFALKYINDRNLKYKFLNVNNLREIKIKGTNIIFVYEYCFSKAALIAMSPQENSVIVNLHNWNGDSCISNDAYVFSRELNVTLLTMEKFYVFINKIKSM